MWQWCERHCARCDYDPSAKCGTPERLRLVKLSKWFISHRLHTGACLNLVSLTYLLINDPSAKYDNDSAKPWQWQLPERQKWQWFERQTPSFTDPQSFRARRPIKFSYSMVVLWRIARWPWLRRRRPLERNTVRCLWFRGTWARGHSWKRCSWNWSTLASCTISRWRAFPVCWRWDWRSTGRGLRPLRPLAGTSVSSRTGSIRPRTGSTSCRSWSPNWNRNRYCVGIQEYSTI